MKVQFTDPQTLVAVMVTVVTPLLSVLPFPMPFPLPVVVPANVYVYAGEGLPDAEAEYEMSAVQLLASLFTTIFVGQLVKLGLVQVPVPNKEIL